MTRTPRNGLLRAEGAGQLALAGHYRAMYAYRPRACHAYHVLWHHQAAASSRPRACASCCRRRGGTVRVPGLTAADAATHHSKGGLPSLAQGGPLAPRGEPSPLGCRGAPALALCCLPLACASCCRRWARPATTHQLPLTSLYSPHITRHPPLATHHSPHTTHHSPHTARLPRSACVGALVLPGQGCRFYRL